MKKTLKSIIAVSLCFIMLMGTVAVGGDGFAELIDAISIKAEAYSIGDYIYYGTYPQTDVTDSLGSVLNSQSGTWKSYGYYSGSGSWSDGKMVASDYMRYKDVTYNGNKYRAVTFDSYRPYYTGYTSSTSNTYQDDNGYTPNNVYWFKYEPIKWRVLDPSTGLVMCATAIDSQAYNNYIWYGVGSLSSSSEYYGNSDHTFYASNYAQSSIRQWLNNDFYNTAFSSEQKSNILSTTLDNKSTYSSTYDSPSTTDKVFLLSYEDSINSSYGFSSSYSDYDSARQLKSTDYAKAQGCYQDTSSSYLGNCWWWLRSPGSSDYARGVNSGGYSDIYDYVYFTYYGVVPALKLQNLKSDYAGSDIEAGGGDSAGNLKVKFNVDDGRGVYLNTDWKWSDFDATNSKYNQRLSVNGLLLSKAAEVSKSQTENILKNVFKFDSVESYDYDTNLMLSPAYTLAKKNVDGKWIFAVVFRGSHTWEDWLTNFNSQFANADGFEETYMLKANIVYNYITSTTSDLSNVKVYITGHSLGGAVTQGVAMQLPNLGISADNIYAYTFASPNVKKTENGTENPGLFNIVNSQDVVPQIPVGNYGHFGTTYTFTRSASKYDNAQKKLWGYSSLPILATDFDIILYNHQLPTYLSYLLTQTPDGSTNQYSINLIDSGYSKNFLNNAGEALYDYCVPYMSDGMIPQGLTYDSMHNWILISAWDHNKEKASAIYALDFDTGEFVAQFNIYQKDKITPAKIHAGGIAATDNNLYITYYDSTIAYVPLSNLTVSKGSYNNQLPIIDKIDLADYMNNTGTAYLNYSDGILWTGNFYCTTTEAMLAGKQGNWDKPAYISYDGDNSTYTSPGLNRPDSHTINTMIFGYKVPETTESSEEWEAIKARNKSSLHYDYNIAIPNYIDGIQGVTIKDGTIYLSRAEYRPDDTSNQEILFKHITLSDNGIGMTLDNNNWGKVTNLAGGENIFIKDGEMYFVYEAAAYAEFNQLWKVKTTQLYDVLWKANVKAMKKGVKLSTINCPVDVEIIDKESGNVVGRITDNKVDYSISPADSGVIMGVDGDTKLYWLPASGDYEVKLIGNDIGTMDYTISEFDENGEIVDRSLFYDLPLSNEITYSAEVNESDTDLSEHILISADNTEIKPDVYTNKLSETLITISTSVQGNGSVSESQTYYLGDKTIIIAEPSQDSHFLGWYENGTLVSNETTYSFVAKDNRTLVAKFEEHNKGNVVSSVSPTCTKDGSTTYQCSVCNESFTVVVPATGHADKNEDGKCDTCGVITNADLANPTRNAKINVAAAKTVDYKSKVTIKATATGVPKGYYLAIYDANGKQLAKAASDGKSTTEVTYEAGNITSDINYTVKVVDAKGNIQKDASGNDLAKDSKVTCNASFFKKLVAFFKSLFGSLPSTIVKP